MVCWSQLRGIKGVNVMVRGIRQHCWYYRGRKAPHRAQDTTVWRSVSSWQLALDWNGKTRCEGRRRRQGKGVRGREMVDSGSEALVIILLGGLWNCCAAYKKIKTIRNVTAVSLTTHRADHSWGKYLCHYPHCCLVDWQHKVWPKLKEKITEIKEISI